MYIEAESWRYSTQQLTARHDIVDAYLGWGPTQVETVAGRRCVSIDFEPVSSPVCVFVLSLTGEQVEWDLSESFKAGIEAADEDRM